MTKKRKLEILKDLLIQLSDSANILCTCEADERCEVIKECIKALEQEIILKEVYDSLLKDVYDSEHFARKQAEQKLYEIQQNTSDDCISRKAVLDMAKSYNTDGWDSYTPLVVDVEDIEQLPPVTPTFPEGATNGDVIKTVFSNYRFSDDFGWINIVLNGRSCTFCPAEFWNSPYKGGNEDGEKDK